MSELRVERRGAVLELVLDRPEKRNPLTRDLRAALEEALRDAAATGLRVARLGARSDRRPVFAAGADLSDIAALSPDEAIPFARSGQEWMRFVERLPLLVLAAVDGPCFGGALDLVLACDLVAVSARARFAHPGARLGIVTGWGGTHRLPNAIGRPGARAAFASARAWGPQEALKTGLAACELPGEGSAFEEAARAWAQDWAADLESVPAERIGSLKRLLSASPAARPSLEKAWLRRLATEPTERRRPEPSA